MKTLEEIERILGEHKEELRRRFKVKEIGMVRFLQSFELGYGDYTKEGHEWLEEDIDKILTSSPP